MLQFPSVSLADICGCAGMQVPHCRAVLPGTQTSACCPGKSCLHTHATLLHTICVSRLKGDPRSTSCMLWLGCTSACPSLQDCSSKTRVPLPCFNRPSVFPVLFFAGLVLQVHADDAAAAVQRTDGRPQHRHCGRQERHPRRRDTHHPPLHRHQQAVCCCTIKSFIP